MKMTSAEAAKLLRKLNERRDSLRAHEEKCCTFVASPEEKLELIRPEYDFAAAQTEIEKLDADIRALRHALNVFNSTTAVPGFDMTIDCMLMYIPQLTARRSVLSYMKDRLPVERMSASRLSPIIEYTYANYDVAAATAEFERISDTLARAQTALDLVNSTATLEVDITE